MAEILTVFLSSTAKDLTAYREAVHARLTANSFFKCIRQEDFGAQTTATVAFCCDHAQKADLFVGLIGLRRGWEPDGDSRQRSITEMEYDAAKPDSRFMYVAPDDFPVPGNLWESKDHYDRQLAFRARVMGAGIVARNGFTSPEELASIVAERLIAHLAQGRSPATTPASLVPADLPDAIVAKLLAALDARGETQKAKEAGVERQTIINLAKRLKPNDTLDFDQAIKELENAVSVAAEVIAKGERPSNDDDFVKTVLTSVADRTKAGEIDRAAKEINDALKELDAREAEQSDRMKRSRISLLEAGIEQDILRRDASSAARRIEKIVALEHPNDHAQRFAALRQRQDRYKVDGRDKGVNFSLEVAIEVACIELRVASDVQQSIDALQDFGFTLWTLGERDSSSARLEEAVTAFRDALNITARNSAPLNWARSQNGLGLALWRLGTRESGTARLEEAVAAYRDALKEWTRERVPLQWAATQNNLGAALQTLGARESGTERLGEAVAAYRDALKEYTRERVPLQWAMTQNNLGNALQTLGARESGTERLGEAVAAYRDALKEYTRERVPLQWAMTQNNLGAALQTLGERESGTARLGEAVAAYRDALKERTRERVPLDWAMSFGNQGVALMHLAERRNDLSGAKQALAQIEAAFQTMRDGGHTPFATYYEAILPKASAVRNKLKTR